MKKTIGVVTDGRRSFEDCVKKIFESRADVTTSVRGNAEAVLTLTNGDKEKYLCLSDMNNVRGRFFDELIFVGEYPTGVANYAQFRLARIKEIGT